MGTIQEHANAIQKAKEEAANEVAEVNKQAKKAETDIALAKDEAEKKAAVEIVKAQNEVVKAQTVAAEEKAEAVKKAESVTKASVEKAEAVKKAAAAEAGAAMEVAKKAMKSQVTSKITPTLNKMTSLQEMLMKSAKTLSTTMAEIQAQVAELVPLTEKAKTDTGAQ